MHKGTCNKPGMASPRRWKTWIGHLTMTAKGWSKMRFSRRRGTFRILFGLDGLR